MSPDDLIVGKSYCATKAYLEDFNQKHNLPAKHIDNACKLIYIGNYRYKNNNIYQFHKLAFGYFVDRAELWEKDLDSIQPYDDFLEQV